MKYAVRAPVNAGGRFYGVFDDAETACKYAAKHGGEVVLIRSAREEYPEDFQDQPYPQNSYANLSP